MSIRGGSSSSHCRSSRSILSKALIVGAYGQDGTILGQQLKAQGVEVVGLGRGDFASSSQVDTLIKQVNPAQIYYLAAYHHSSQDNMGDDHGLFTRSYAVHVDGLLSFLEAMRKFAPAAKLFYASSSHVFGRALTSPQNEETPLSPICPYGITKTAGMQIVRYYRQSHGLFAASGILYNHESPLRRPEFLSRKIVRAAVGILKGQENSLILGDLKARADWGYAPEYTQAMQLILGLSQPQDFVIASGKSYQVEDFVAVVFGELGLDWRKYVQENPQLLRKNIDRGLLVGDAGLLQTKTGWQARMGLQEIAKVLIAAEKEADNN